jgi:hypothetical protein
MDRLDQRIYLLETLRELDYKIIDRRHEDVATLEQHREELKTQLNALLARTA